MGVAGEEMAGVIAAVDRVVPHLPEYKTLYENLSGLLKFCEQECVSALFELLCSWLAVPPSSSSQVPFACWLYGYVEEVSDAMVGVDGERWKQALLLAALQEAHPSLRRKLLKFIDSKVGSMEGVISTRLSAQNDPLRLLLLLWRNADALSQSAMLCATKFAALAVTSTAAAASDDVFTFIRWARILKPLLFENVVHNLVIMKVYPKAKLVELAIPESIHELMTVTSSLRPAVLKGLMATREKISEAYRRNVKYLRRRDPSRPAWVELCEQFDENAPVDRVLAILNRDLSVVHGDVFPHVFAALVVVAISSLKSTQNTSAAMSSIKCLLSLLELRVDRPSLFMVLSAIMELQVGAHFAWAGCPAEFRSAVQDLSEQIVLETTAAKKWVLQLALQQLLLECDGTVLSSHVTFLQNSLPNGSLEVVRHRIAQ